MTILYYGADHNWLTLTKIGFNRRNTCLLEALDNDKQVSKIYLVRRTTKWQLFKLIYYSRKSSNKKIRDIYFASIIPERGLFVTSAIVFNRFIARVLIYIQSRKLSERDYHWCYWPKGFQDYRYIGLKGKLLFDCDHNILDDPNLKEQDKPSVTDLLLQVSKKADLIFSTSRIMNQWFEKQGAKNVKRIRNGVDNERFTNVSIDKKGLKPIVGYCGTLSKWMDQDLLEDLIQRNPQWDFWIIGDEYLTNIIERIGLYDNVKLFGKIAADRIPELFNQFNVAISLYLEMEGMDVDSMKIFEYLAAGVPVVSTRFHEYLDEDFGGLLYLEDDTDGFEQSINKCISLDEAEKENLKTKSKNFAKENSWEKRVKEILNSINAG